MNVDLPFRQAPLAGAARALGLLCTLGAVFPAAHANHGEPPTAPTQTLVIEGHYDNAVGTTDAASAGTVRRGLIEARGAQRPGEVLEFVPGVIVTQHSGDGKANQYFLRGFNLDHGTDFATRLAGMPLNLPSHGHGQGYTDLGVLIPELVERMVYRKGPYAADSGDFAAAGSADIRYLSRLPAPLAQLTLGPDRYRRVLLGASHDLQPGLTALAAFEHLGADGPWTVRQGLRKRNGVASLTGGTRSNGWHVMAMGMDSRWTATDQIPERLLRNGSGFGRFDSLDDTTGGRSRRASLSGDWHADTASGRTTVSGYVIRHHLDLYSNFTYALERPEQGDQFTQRDDRTVWGVDVDHAFNHDLGAFPARTAVGVQWRHDRIANGLYDSVARRITDTVREDRIRLGHLGVYGSTSVELSAAWRLVLGLRADRLDARVNALTEPLNGGKASDALVSPKVSVVWSPAPALELFGNLGRGLHSNDARGMTARVDPRSGDPVDPVQPLVPLRGAELGLRWQPSPGWQTSVALWSLNSDSELVYVGDAGGTEASRASRRRGVEISQRWRPLTWFLLDADLSWSRGRLSDGGRIPNAVDTVASVTGTVRPAPGWTGSLHWRYRGSGALIEDNSIRARPASTLNLRVMRQVTPQVALTLDVFNLTDRDVEDIQYAYESQLPGEAAPVLDRHLHPAEPRSLRLTLQARF
jgi:outer membrane receptor protein involved in Fe transport